MANAQDLISFAMAAVNRQPPLLYGQKAINLLSQRGPDSYDCIGFYRWCVLSIAPNLWPTSWGGEDSWTVPNYWGNVQGHFPIDNGPALAGDALIWIDNNGIQQHIAISDGKGNAISALNTIKNICIVQASSINLPIMKVVHNGLEQKVSAPLGTPTGIIRIGTDPSIRGGRLGGWFTEPLPLGTDVVCYGETTVNNITGETNSPVWRVALGGEMLVLKRNAVFTAIGGDPIQLATLQAKITKAIAALS